VNGTCYQSSPDMPRTTTDNYPAAAADSAPVRPPVGDLSQKRIKRRTVLSGLIKVTGTLEQFREPFGVPRYPSVHPREP
jgi:hypothetical protein